MEGFEVLERGQKGADGGGRRERGEEGLSATCQVYTLCSPPIVASYAIKQLRGPDNRKRVVICNHSLSRNDLEDSSRAGKRVESDSDGRRA